MALFRKAVSVWAMILALTTFALPQEKMVLTLEESIRLALLQNPFHLAEKAKEDQASSMVREAVAGFFPNLTAMGTDVLDKKVFTIVLPSFIPDQPPQSFKMDFTRKYQLSLNFSLPLSAGGRLASGYKQAKLNLMSTREGIRLSQQETVFNVKRAFYGYLLAQKFAEVAGEAVNLAEKHFKNVKSLYDVGMASRFDLLRSEVQAANLKPQLIRAKNGLSVAELALKNLIGVDLNQPVEIKGELQVPVSEVDPESSVSRALAGRPELTQLKYQQQMASEMLKMARGAHFPALGLTGQYNYWGNQFKFGKDKWESYYSVNLVLAFPIFDGFLNSAKVGESKAMIRQLDYSQKGLSEMVKFEVREAILNLQQAKEALSSQGKTVEEAQEAVRIAELNYKEGLTTNLDVSSAHMALSQARTNYSQALYDCVIALAQLEKATGSNQDDPIEK
jgi:outer membrane protein